MKLQKLHPLLTATLFVTIFVLLYLMFNSPPQMSPVPNTAEIEIEVVQDTPEITEEKPQISDEEIQRLLDVENEQKIMNEIFSSSQLIKFLIITHRHQTVQNCDNIFLLDQGKLIDQGEYDYLNNKHNLNSFIKKIPH